MAAFKLPALRNGYRDTPVAAPTVAEISRLLGDAREALNLAVITSGGSGQGRSDQLRRGEQARAFLVEAVGALGRARVYMPRLRTQSLPVVLASEPNPGAELARLQAMATRLLWQNHQYLPARSEAKPLPPEEEAQLALWQASIRRSGQVSQALAGYGWCGLALLLGGAAALLQVPAVALLAAVGAVVLGLFRLVRGDGGRLARDAA